MKRRYGFIVLYYLIPILLTGCTALRFAGQALEATGKVASATGKVAVATVKTTGKIVTTTGKVIETVIFFPGRRKEIGLTKKGNTLLVNVLLNRRVKAVLVLDTGCSDTQISAQLARRLGIRENQGERILCTLADGRLVSGRAVSLKEIRLKKVRVRNVKAVIFDQDRIEGHDGLLGMSFLNNFTFKIDPERNVLVLERKGS